jgi:hypothetical protein
MTLGFKGTEWYSIPDWWDNLDTDIEYNVGSSTTDLHEGFVEYMEDNEACINSYVDQLDGYGIPVDFFLGASLGGAGIQSYWWKQDGRRSRHGVMTFGSPKNRKDGSCGIPGKRFWQPDDCITSDGPSNVLSQFKHDVQNGVKLWEREYNCFLGMFCDIEYKKSTTAGCGTEGNYNGVVSCLGHFATTHLNYGDFAGVM